MDYLRRLADFRLIAKPLIDAYESCLLTDPNDDLYLDRDLHEDHSSRTLYVVLEALKTAIQVQFPEIEEPIVMPLVKSWEYGPCTDWHSLRKIIQEELS